MKITIVSGSSRKNSQSAKVSQFIATNLTKNKEMDVAIVDLSTVNLPLFDDALWDTSKVWNENWATISSKLQQSDGFIFVSPEWDGMVPPALKNIFNLCCNGELYHKPALIVSVSAGEGGAYPIVELRISSYKNTKICYLPEHMIIRKVRSVLNNIDSSESEYDQSIRERLNYYVEVLLSYTKAFSHIRSSGVLNRERYKNGQ